MPSNIPASFIKDGFYTPPANQPQRFRKLMIGTDGLTNTGKTEFMLSCPGPGIIISVDCGTEGCMENPKPPVSRRSDIVIFNVSIPMNTTREKPEYVEYWVNFRKTLYRALDNPDARMVGLDGDSDSWELQRLAEFGKLAQVPQLQYGDVNAKRRAMIKKCYESGKTFVSTNKVKPEYVPIIDPTTGEPQIDPNSGRVMRQKSDGFERQGFSDQDYLYQVQLHHMNRKDPDKEIKFGSKIITKKGGWHYGIRITKCKMNMDLEGAELWDEHCNFAGLVSFIYPNSDPKEWGL